MKCAGMNEHEYFVICFGLALTLNKKTNSYTKCTEYLFTNLLTKKYLIAIKQTNLSKGSFENYNKYFK